MQAVRCCYCCIQQHQQYTRTFHAAVLSIAGWFVVGWWRGGAVLPLVQESASLFLTTAVIGGTWCFVRGLWFHFPCRSWYYFHESTNAFVSPYHINTTPHHKPFGKWNMAGSLGTVCCLDIDRIYLVWYIDGLGCCDWLVPYYASQAQSV